MEINAASSLHALQVHRIYGAIRPVAPVTPLAAGRVHTPADPSLAPGLAAGGTLQLYGRAADRIEAATAVSLGRIVDHRA